MKLRILHKWLGILIGLQVFIWVVSGMLISLLDQQVVSGRVTNQSVSEKHELGEVPDLLPLQNLNIDGDPTLRSVRLERVDTQLIYYVQSSAGTLAFNALNGQRFRLSQDAAERIANQSYRGTGSRIDSTFNLTGFSEVMNHRNVWRITYDDKLKTRVYISALDGAVLAHRNQYSRLVDILLMLHFMDYARTHSFNNPQIIVVGFLTLWLALSGLLLVVTSFTRRDFTWRGLTR